MKEKFTRKSPPLSMHIRKSICKTIVHIHPRERALKSQRTPSLIEKVKLSLQKPLPSTCPTVSHTAAYPLLIHVLFLQMNEIRFWRENWLHKIFFPMADQISPGVCKNVMLAGQVHWNLQALKIHRRFTDLPLMLFKS